MSYVLAVFSPPPELERPASINAMGALVDDMYARAQPSDGMGYRRLVKALHAHAPPSGDKEWLRILSDEDRGPVYNIAIDPHQADALQALVVQCARALGFAVFDTQAGQGFWPDGSELALEPLTPVGPDSVKMSELAPVQLPPGTPYMLYWAGHQFTANETECAKILPQMLAENTPRNGTIHRFVVLQERLAERFGYLAADAGSVWRDDLPDGTSVLQVYAAAVRAECIARVRPEMIELAANLWLRLFDPQAGQVYHPNGQISWRGAHWKTHEQAPSNEELVASLAGMAAPLLEADGFKRRAADPGKSRGRAKE